MRNLPQNLLSRHGTPVLNKEGYRHNPLNVKVKESGAPGGIRTPDLLVRSQTLYPTELRARLSRSNFSLPQVIRAYSKLRPCSTPDFLPQVVFCATKRRPRRARTQAQGFAVPTAASLILSLKCSSSDGTQSSSKIAAFARTNVTVSPTQVAVYTFGSVMVISTVNVSASG